MLLKTRAALVVVVGTVMGVSLSMSGGLLQYRPPVDNDDRALEQAQLFAEVMQRVKREYVEPLDDAELLDAAIRGMVADLDALAGRRPFAVQLHVPARHGRSGLAARLEKAAEEQPAIDAQRVSHWTALRTLRNSACQDCFCESSYILVRNVLIAGSASSLLMRRCVSSTAAISLIERLPSIRDMMKE